jgi:hypothetical protein
MHGWNLLMRRDDRASFSLALALTRSAQIVAGRTEDSVVTSGELRAYGWYQLINGFMLNFWLALLFELMVVAYALLYTLPQS